MGGATVVAAAAASAHVPAPPLGPPRARLPATGRGFAAGCRRINAAGMNAGRSPLGKLRGAAGALAVGGAETDAATDAGAADAAGGAVGGAADGAAIAAGG